MSSLEFASILIDTAFWVLDALNNHQPFFSDTLTPSISTTEAFSSFSFFATSDIIKNFSLKLSKLNKNIRRQISEVEYSKTEVDEERFLLYMTDSNYVYITLTKIDKLNKYNSIVEEMDNKKGIIYLDSGDYVEIKG